MVSNQPVTVAIIGAKIAAGAGADQHAVDELELEQACGGLASASPQRRAARRPTAHEARPDAVAQRAPAEAGDAHGQEVERHARRDAGA